MTDTTSIPVLGAAWGIGANNPGAALGPVVLKHSDLLLKRALSLDWQALIYTQQSEPGLSAMNAIARACEQLAHEACLLAQTQPFFLTLGGDHSCAIGTWSGVAQAYAKQGPIGLIWIDAHLDAHTPETSETGNIHGMPLAALLGEGDKRLTEILTKNPKLLPQNVVHMGARSFESAEHDLLQRLNVRMMTMDEIKTRGFTELLQEAYQIVTHNTAGFGVSFCLDVIDAKEAPGVSTPEADGIATPTWLHALPTIANDPKLSAFEIAEFNPNCDRDQLTETLIAETLQLLLAERHTP